MKRASILCFVVILVTSITPGNAEATTNKADSARDSAKILARIENKLNKAIPPTEADFSQLGEIVSAEPNNINAHLVLGMAYESMGLLLQGIEQYQMAIKLSPNDPHPLFRLLVSRINMGEEGQVVNLIDLAKKKWPNNPEVIFLAGWDALQHKKIALADQYFSHAFQLDPDIPTLKAAFGEVKYNEKEYAKAYQLAKMELARQPDNFKANVVAGKALAMSKKHLPESVQYLKAASEAVPEMPDLNDMLAQVAEWSAQYSDAIKPALRLMAVTSSAFNKNERTQRLLVQCLRHVPKETALDDIQDVSQKFERATTNSYFHEGVGQVLSTLGWHDEAIAHFEKAIVIMPSNGMARYYLAQEYETYPHDYARAILEYKKAEQSGLPAEVRIVDHITRAQDRLSLERQDLAEQLKDFLQGRWH